MQGQSRWHKGSPLPRCWRESLLVPQHREMPPGHAAQPPAPPALPLPLPQPSPAWPIFLAGTAAVHRRAGSAQTRGTHRTDRHQPCTGTHARRRGRHKGTRVLPAAQPQPPHPSSLEPVALSTGLWQAAGALPAARGSLGVLAANREESHHTGVPRGMRALHMVGSSGSVSSCRTIHGSQPHFQGAKALTCPPA